MALTAPPANEVLDFQFKLHCRLKLFNNEDNAVFGKPCSLVAAASRYGLVFVGTASPSFQVLSLENLEQIAEKKSDVTNYLKRTVNLPSQPTHLSVNCDSTLLCVVVEKESCPTALIYNISSFATQDVAVIKEIRLSATPGVFVVEVCWNPTIPGILTVCKSDKSLGLYEFKGPSIDINEIPPASGSTCMCWSPKGKQLAVGSLDGKITQYKPDLKPVKAINAPQLEGGTAVLALQWVSNYQFIAIYGSTDPESRANLVVVDAPKTGETKYTNYEDVCYSYGSTRPIQFYMILQPIWNVLMVASSNSMEVGILGLSKDQQWTQWALGDAARAELPLSPKKQDTLPVGLAVDVGTKTNIHWGENTLPPAPFLYLMSHHGVLCCFHIVNVREGAAPICQAPETLPENNGLKYFTRESSVEVKTVAVEPAVVQPQQQPQQTQEQQQLQQQLQQQQQQQQQQLQQQLQQQQQQQMLKQLQQQQLQQLLEQQVQQQQNQQPQQTQELLQQQQLLQERQQLQQEQQQLLQQQQQQKMLKQLQQQQSQLLEQQVQQQQQVLAQQAQFATPKPKQNLFGALKSTYDSPQLFGAAAKTLFNSPQQTPQIPTPQPIKAEVKPLISTPPATPTESVPATLKVDAETEKLLSKMIREECVSLESEIRALLHKSQSLKISLGSDAESTDLVKNTEDLNVFLEKVTETSVAQAAEIHTLKQKLLQSWAWFEDARSRFAISKDPAMAALIRTQPLDPASQQHLDDFTHLLYYIESQLVQANNTLDEQWENFQDFCKKTYKAQLPTMETIYQAMVRQTATVQKQNYILKDIGARLRKHSSSHASIALLASFENADEVVEKLKGLQLQPQDLMQVEYERVLKKQRQLSGEKVDKLAEFFVNNKPRVIKVIKPKVAPLKLSPQKSILEANMSPVVSKAKESVPRMLDLVQSTPKPFTPTATPPSTPLSGIQSKPFDFNSHAFFDTKPSGLFSSAFAATTQPSAAKPTITPVVTTAKTNTTVSTPPEGFATLATAKSTVSFPPATSEPAKFSFAAISTAATTTTASTNFRYVSGSNVPTTQMAIFASGTNTVVSSPGIIKPTAKAAIASSFVQGTQPSVQGSLFGKSNISFGSKAFEVMQKPVAVVSSSEAQVTESGFSFVTGGVTATSLASPKTTQATTTTASIFAGQTELKTSPSVGTTTSSSFFGAASTKPSIFASAAATTPTTTSIFGSTTTTASIFATVKPAETKSIFGTAASNMFGTAQSAPATTTANLFGATTTTASLFGATSAASVFGTAQSQPKTSIFAAATTISATATTTSTTSVATTPSTTPAVATISASIFGAAAVTTATTTSSLFGSIQSATTKSSLFGSVTTPSMFGSTAATATSVSGVGTTPTTTSANVFGSAAKATTASIFGGATTTTTATTSAAFGSTPTASVAATPPVTTGSLFGAVAPATSSVFGGVATTTTATSIFGSATTTGGIFAAAAAATTTVSTTPKNIFGTTPATTAGIFGSATTATTTSGSVFGAATTTTSIFGAAAATTTTASIFGSAASTTTSSVFGGAAPATTTASIFGTAGAASTASSIFGAAAAAAAAATTASTTAKTIFGVAASEAAAAAASAATTPTSSIFGAAATTPGSSVFGATTTAGTTFGSPPATTSSIFGTPAATTTSIFGSSSPFGSTAFGGQKAPAFGGAVTTTTSVFGSAPVFASTAPATFGNATPAQQPAFGSGSIFGTPASSTSSSIFGGTPTGFGKPATAAPAFGTAATSAPAFGSAASTFSFASAGANVPNTNTSFGFNKPAGGGDSAFSFGSLNVGTTTATSTGFGGGFGQAQTANPFGRADAAKPAFGSSSGSIFGSPAATSTTSGFGSTSTFGGGAPFGGGATFGASPGFGQSTFGQSGVGGGSTFGSPSQTSGPFSAGGQSVGQTGFGSGGFQSSPGGFGGPPVFGATSGFGAAPAFGSAPSFGSTSTFNSPGKSFGSNTFGSAGTQQNPTFGNLANQNTLGFGSLAQQSPPTAPQQSAFGSGSSFSSWR